MLSRILICMLAVAALATEASAQLTPQRTISGTTEPVSRLQEQLINGLRATRVEQQAFLKTVVTLNAQGKLDRRLINAIYLWAQRRQPLYPFPYFERGLRLEASKRGITLPAVALVIRGNNISPPAPLPGVNQ